jgi:hypothetical protein
MTGYLSSFAISFFSIDTCIPDDRHWYVSFIEIPDDVCFYFRFLMTCSKFPSDLAFHQIPDDMQLDCLDARAKTSAEQKDKTTQTLSTSPNPLDGRMLGKFHFFS